ncbi:uncharacterized protein TNCT_449351 [Trichonephila clavata]|uniref:Uncharacterized protein n=1 Tax=Trichonephila clavata TaxID=2740835 RepID=A0A8X6H676_TRICU|nr:uncharacterized protein TNCT_449351 [Trichonephila clavata]
MYNWMKTFSQGRSKIVDDQGGRPVLIVTKSTEQQVEEFIRADRRVTIDSISTAIRCSHGLAYSIMHDRLNFQKCTFVIHFQKTHVRMNLSKSGLPCDVVTKEKSPYS